MTKRMMNRKRDLRKLRAIATENTVTQTMTPSAGALTGGTQNVAHAGVTFALSAPVGNARYSVAAGALPTGMSLNASTGVLTGTPTVVGANSFSIRGTDDFGNTKVNAYTLAVAAP